MVLRQQSSAVIAAVALFIATPASAPLPSRRTQIGKVYIGAYTKSSDGAFTEVTDHDESSQE